MPCNSDYLEPRGREVELHRAARLYQYVLLSTHKPVPQRVQQAAESIYGQDRNGDPVDCVSALCAAIKRMDNAMQKRVVYTAESRDARDLANWWEDHQQADSQREAAEADEKKQAALKARALKKLTKEEREALGL